ncbi:hypothetical protein [Flavobacterium sp.]|jgi:hypothetical protein|uniref:hypothetical protein n=1 Tax=Flavobacterium sp. TaxID=239 RepID=UPI002A81CB0E|nr:hypothetical protein [Flavobacterium sp.]
MKTNKIVLTLVIGLFANIVTAQVGIGTTNPQQMLHISGTNPGLQTLRIDDCAVTAGGTNPGELATGASTTSKALYSDSNGDIKVRYIYGDNMQSVVLPSGTQNITNTSLIDITGATITFTPRHSVVYLSFSITGYNPLTSGIDPLTWFSVGVSRGATNIANFLSLTGVSDDVTGSAGAASITAANFPITVTPGVSVTIKLRGRNGGINNGDGFTIDKTNYTSYMTILD